MNKIVSVGIGIVVVVIVVAAVFLFVMPLSSPSSNSPSSNSGSNSNSSVGINKSSGGSSSNTGSGTPLITKSQSQSTFGPGGNYTEATETNQVEINATDPDIPTALLSGISKAWIMGYSPTQDSSFYAAIEIIFQSSNPNGLYTYILENSTSSNSSAFSTVNASLDGMTYSYGESTSGLNSTLLVGVDGDYVVTFLDIGQAIGENQLVQTIATDLS